LNGAVRVRSIDMLRGLAVLLMTVDHAGSALDAAHLHGDSARNWVAGTPLPAAEFLTRWITHLCAPSFVLLAGASLALSIERRGESAETDGFILRRGLLIAALDPLWMSLGFAGYHFIILQVLYALGLSMVCMAPLRRLSTATIATLAGLILVFGELSNRLTPSQPVLAAAWRLLWTGGLVGGRWVCGYPLLPWLAIMMSGWVLGRWWLGSRARLDDAGRARALAGVAVALTMVFVVVRGANGYGNWGLHRDPGSALSWLHTAKYPPSISYVSSELAIAFALLAAFTRVEASLAEARWAAPLLLFGSTAFFYYVLHVHLIAGFAMLLHLDPKVAGLMKTWVGALAAVLVLAGPTARYRRYKAMHPDGWTRYL
jgi:uncharacterized membrane protein